MIFPVAIIDSVKNFEDPVWEMVLHLRETCAVTCAPAPCNLREAINFEGKCFFNVNTLKLVNHA